MADPSERSGKSGGQVRVLPDALSNQIAAGEVVERPASVIKELVENALDAGATRVVVEISGDARDLAVTDDGVGMHRDDAVTAIRRFATSKIAEIADLHRIETYGFRGEALPSIASVSRFMLETRPHSDAVGTRVEVEGGTLVRVAEVGCPVGTRVSVKDLFYNTPARLKFMKTPATEVRHAVGAVAKIALAMPGVGFKVVEDGVTELQIAPEATLLERIGAVIDPKVAKRAFAFEGRSNGVTARGYAAAPDLARSNARDLLIYVNGRVVKDRTIQAAVNEAYRSLLPHGRHPTAVVLLEVPPDLVDVNVHPAKTEIRFARTDDVWRAVHRGIETALREAPWARSATGRVPTAVPLSFPRAGEPAVPGGSPTTTDPGAGLPVETVAAIGPREAAGEAEAESREPARIYRLISGNVAAPFSGPRTEAMPADPDDPRTFFRSVRVFGQYKQTYLLGERNGELVVIDQHAAHERVMFEKLKIAAGKGAVPVQRLLVPTVVELSAAEAKGAVEALPALAAAGLEAEPFGERAIAVRAVPAALARVDAERLLRDALDEVRRHGKSGTLADRMDDVFARMACHAAVRAGDPLSADEVSRLLAEMDGIDFAANCPHGRPVVVRFPATEVEKWFDRR